MRYPNRERDILKLTESINTQWGRRAGMCLGLIGGLLLLGASSVLPEIEFKRLDQNKAVLYVNKGVNLLRPGQRTREGVRLVSANKNEAVIQFKGAFYRYRKGSKKGVRLPSDVVLSKNHSGQFIAKGVVNGRSARFIVDTGATSVFISANDARRLKIRYKKNRKTRYTMTTAQGTMTAYLTKLNSIRIGGIEVRNVKAFVAKEKNYPSMPLLGMSFLEHVTVAYKQGKMLLSQ